MTWQIAITLQVLVSSFMTLLTRRVTLTTKNVFLGIGVLVYFMIGVMGFIYSLVYNHGLPVAPSPTAWLYILVEGLCIPLAWLAQYKMINYIGAGNAIIVSVLNTTAAALAGIILLHDSFSPAFAIGAALILASALASLRLSPDMIHPVNATLPRKVLLATSGALLFAVGMYAEKMAINSLGAFNYSAFGWGMQFVGASVVFLLFGRGELPHISASVMRKGLLLGLITSVAGALYIYALSIGNLSHTIVAASGKVAITVFLAAVFLKERNALKIRVGALLVSVVGLWIITFS